MNFLNYSKDIMSLIKQGERDQLDSEMTSHSKEMQLPKLDIPDEELEQLGKIGVLADELDVADNDSEDEGIEDYKDGGYHPVYIGECLIGRYVVLQKLGWGHFSTVWLCKDLKYDTYVAIKLQKSASHYLEAAFDEVEILQKAVKHSETKEWYEDLKDLDGGRRKKYSRDDCYTVQLLNAFIYQGPYGKHFCMVFEILGVNLLEIIKRYKYKGIPIHLCRKMARQLLIGLHYLHTHCGIIHTDLKPENVMLCLDQKELDDIIKHKQLYKNDATENRLRNLRAKIGVEVKDEIKISDQEKNSVSTTDTEKKKEDTIESTLDQMQPKKKFSEIEENTDKKNLNFSKKEDASRVVDGEEVVNETKGSKEGERGKKEEILEEKEMTSPSETNGDSNASSQVSGSLRDIVDLLILTHEDMEREINRLMIEEPPKDKTEHKRLKKRVKRKMKRHQKRWNKMSETEQQKYQLARESLELRLQHQRNSNVSNDPNVQMEISKTSNDPPKVEDELAVIESTPQTPEEVEVRYNEDAFDLSTGLRKNFKLKIADLGNGCWTHYHFQPEIQTRQYRGPEVILGINYNETADLWSLACMLFEMLTGDFLFDPKKSGDFKKNDDHLAQMLELLNEFPKNWSTIGTNSKRYFDKDGRLKKIKSLRFWGLKDILIQRYKMAENEALALEDFLLPMLRVLPQERATAKEMMNHPWLSMTSQDFRNKDPTIIISNDEERFKRIINETDVYADVSRSDCEEEEEEEDDDFVIEGKVN
jgi:serine/threonine protein kinase